MAQVPGEQRRRCGAVDIVIAEDRDLFVSYRSVRNSLGGYFHLGHGVRIRHQLADGRIEEIFDRIDLDNTPGGYTRQLFRQLVTLCDRKRPRRAAGMEPVAPQLTGER